MHGGSLNPRNGIRVLFAVLAIGCQVDHTGLAGDEDTSRRDGGRADVGTGDGGGDAYDGGSDARDAGEADADIDAGFDAGFEDVDGCEPDECVAGGACPTSCGSTGAFDCTDACAPTCRAPAESCNVADDDCDGTCDEGGIPGCRVGVHRMSNGRGHFYTTNVAEAESGYMVENANYFYLYAAAAPGLRPFYRCLKPNGLYFYTPHFECEDGGTNQGVLGYGAAASICGSTPLFRLFLDGDHFYASNEADKNGAIAAGWVFEGETEQAWLAP